MKKILFILLLMFLGACRPSTQHTTGIFDYNIITIDGCEYIEYTTAYYAVEVTHKGDCKNSIHYQNKSTVIDTITYIQLKK